MAMFCTNCGEEMRAIDKFCASCGTAAAPRPARMQETTPAPPEPAAPTRPAQSTAEAFRTPVAPANVANARPDVVSFAPAQPSRVNQPAPPPQPAAVPEAPLSRQQQQRVLLEGEEIAATRGMLPIDALPEEFPPTSPSTPAVPLATGQTCASCGEQNPAGNRYCERCGRSLDDGSVDGRVPTSAPTATSSWLDQPQPLAAPKTARAEAAARGTGPAVPKAAAVAPHGVASHGVGSHGVGSHGKDEPFFYIYDDTAAQRGNSRLVIALLVVLALGVLGVIYMMSRSPAKRAATGNVTITISPTEAQVPAGEAHDFSATVTGSGDTDVTWSVQEGSSGGSMVNHGARAEGGAVASMAVYIAPSSAGTYHVVATSDADKSKSATAEVTVSGK